MEARDDGRPVVRAPEGWRKILREATRLVDRRDRRALDLLLPALRWRDQGARDRAVALLVRLGPVAVTPLLRVLAGGKTATERRGAADALGRIRDSRAVPALLKSLRDPGMSVRRAAMVALLRLEAMDAVPRIVRLLEDASGGVRVLAALVLGKFEDPRAVPGLIGALRDPMWYVRQAAATALGAIGDRRAVSALEVAIRDPSKTVSRAAAAALRSLLG
jgi:HEAT repeat protein